MNLGRKAPIIEAYFVLYASLWKATIQQFAVG